MGNSYFFLAAIAALAGAAFFKVGVRGGIPDHTETIKVHHDIPCLDIVLGLVIVLMWEKVWEIVVRYLLDQRVFGADENVFQQARLRV